MKKKTVVSVMAVAMLFAVSLFFVGGTYARYATEFTGTASATVATWAVKVNDTPGNAEEATTLELPFTVAASDYVVANKIAPTVTATSTVTVDLTGTETAVELVVEKGADFASKVTALGLKEADIEFTIEQDASNKAAVAVEADGDGTSDNPFVLLLPNKEAFTEANGKLVITLTLKWANDDADNPTDTKVGMTGGKLEVPVTLKVQQHIAA